MFHLNYFNLAKQQLLLTERFFVVVENGNYSQWTDWSQCSVTCGVGSRTRTRSCTNPPPGPYGDDCFQLGNNTQKVECNATSCPGSILHRCTFRIVIYSSHTHT